MLSAIQGICMYVFGVKARERAHHCAGILQCRTTHWLCQCYIHIARALAIWLPVWEFCREVKHISVRITLWPCGVGPSLGATWSNGWLYIYMWRPVLQDAKYKRRSWPSLGMLGCTGHEIGPKRCLLGWFSPFSFPASVPP